VSTTALRSRERSYTFGLGTLATLVAGRSSYRLIVLATTVLLLPAWGTQRYGTFAAAAAAFSWLSVVAVTGPEKTLLKLRPRAPRVGAAVSDALVAVVWWAPLPLAAGFALALVLRGADPPVTVYLGVAAMQLSTGCTLLLVGMLRAAGRTRPDAVAYLAMSVAQLVLLVAAVAGGLGPAGYAAAVVALQLGVNLALSATLGRPSLRIRHRPRLLGRLAVTAGLLAAPELFLYLTTAVLFGLLAASAHADQVGGLFAVLLVWSAGFNLLIYLMRVNAPRTALRLTGRAGRAGRARAARLARWVAATSAAWLAGSGVLLVTTDLAGVTDPGRLLPLWTLLLVTRAPVLAGLLWTTFQVENTDATAPRVVAAAAVVGLAAVSLAGLAMVPALGGVGVLVSVGFGELGYALVLAARAAPRTAPA
jgi:hypothetical protein